MRGKSKTKVVLTESESFAAARLENERGCSHEGKETARNDEVKDVVAWLASKMEHETDARVWCVAARVVDQRLLD